MTTPKDKSLLSDEQYRILSDRMIEEHRKYGDHLRPGHWAEIAARKVVSHMDDFDKEGLLNKYPSHVRDDMRKHMALYPNRTVAEYDRLANEFDFLTSDTVKGRCEAARAKDAELIRMALIAVRYAPNRVEVLNFLSAAAAAGFTPTNDTP